MLEAEIDAFLAATSYAVVGASRSPEKYGSLVYRALKAAGRSTYPVNPQTDQIDGAPCYPALSALPVVPQAAVLVVPPAISEAAVAECIRLGIGHIWMQPGAESPAAVAAGRAGGLSLVWGGPCLLVALRLRSIARS